jgi:hypothetical protein
VPAVFRNALNKYFLAGEFPPRFRQDDAKLVRYVQL